MRRLIVPLFAAVLLLPSKLAIAVNLGTWGDVWEIKEQNFLSVIHERLTDYLADKSEDELREELRKRVIQSAMRPPPVEGVHRGKETRMRLFDPAITVAKDMADHEGNIFARKGQRISPFDAIPVFNQTLYFIDGDDPEQVEWMKQQEPKTPVSKIILVNGNIRDTTESLDLRVYFDQGGSLSRRFEIKQVPAIVEQEPGKPMLRITEVGLR